MSFMFNLDVKISIYYTTSNQFIAWRLATGYIKTGNWVCTKVSKSTCLHLQSWLICMHITGIHLDVSQHLLVLEPSHSSNTPLSLGDLFNFSQQVWQPSFCTVQKKEFNTHWSPYLSGQVSVQMWRCLRDFFLFFFLMNVSRWMCHDWLCCCCSFWTLGGAEQVSRKSGAESGLLLPSHLSPRLSSSRHSLEELQEQPAFARLSHFTSGS